jgi:hypothetical protein
MPAAIEVSDANIAEAERLLLPDGATFDDERRAFIRRFDTLDLQAVPGSGKTTALLAKLIILERYLPFSDGSGTLVLSHTNAAMDEITAAIGHLCPRLFSYPNFAGTIQSFVDCFLAIPYFCSRSQKRPLRIHNDLYEVRAGSFRRLRFPGFTADETTRAKYYLNSTQGAATIRYALAGDPPSLTSKINGKPLTITKPRGKPGAAFVDWSPAEKERVSAWLLAFKASLMKDGVLCFDDAYFLAHRYLAAYPAVAAMLRLRFRHVFVDEMQDMGRHQHDLLELIFHPGGQDPCNYQRVGDRNQAIHNELDFADEMAWIARNPTLELTNSLRLSPQTAAVVSTFALQSQPGFKINGLNHAGPNPVMIVYDDATVTSVLRKFSTILREQIDAGNVPLTPKSRFRAIAWNTIWANDESARGKLRLVDYYPEFNRVESTLRAEYPSLEACLRVNNQPDSSLRIREAAIMNAFLKALRLEGLQNPTFETYFTRQALLAHLRHNLPDYYGQFRLLLYEWCVAAANGNVDTVIQAVRNHVPMLLAQFNCQCNKAKDFVSLVAGAPIGQVHPIAPTNNVVNFDGFDIVLASVHAVKGQTHTATLYFETAYGQDGHGAQARSYESQRLAPQFLATRLTGHEGKRTQQSAKMVYVGFSRPSHLLCFAVHRNRFNAHLPGVEALGWTITPLA